jgi:hypothetical protein
LTDKLLFIAAFASLVYSEILFFNGYENHAIFIGLSGTINTLFWHLLTSNKRKKMTDFIPYFAGIITYYLVVAFAYHA